MAISKLVKAGPSPTIPRAAVTTTSESKNIEDGVHHPASNFVRHNVLGDGNCFFHCMNLAMGETSVNSDRHELQQAATKLRAQLHNYISENADALSKKPFFRNDAVDTIGELKEHLNKSKMYAFESNDLTLPLAAHLLERDIHVLIPGKNGDYLQKNISTYPANNIEISNSTNPDKNNPPIYLLKLDDHYNLLEKRYTHRPILPHSSFSSRSSSIADTTTQENLSFSLRVNQVQNYTPTQPDEHLLKLTKKYHPFIEKNLLPKNVGLNKASSEQLRDALKLLGGLLDDYSATIKKIDKIKKNNPRKTAHLKALRSQKKRIENRLMDNTKLLKIKQKGRQELLKSMHLIHERIALELQFKAQDDKTLIANNKAIDELAKKLKKPGFFFDDKKLQKDISKLDAKKSTYAFTKNAMKAHIPLSKENTLTNERWHKKISVTELNQEIKSVIDTLKMYKYTIKDIKLEEMKDSPLSNQEKLKTAKSRKLQIENNIKNRMIKTRGIQQKSAEQVLLTYMHVLHEKFDHILKKHADNTNNSESTKVEIKQALELLEALKNSLDTPGFRVNKQELTSNIIEQLSHKNVDDEHKAIMAEHMQSLTDTLGLLSSKTNTDTNTENRPLFYWQSESLDQLVVHQSKQLAKLQEKLIPEYPLTDSELLDVGIKMHQILDKSYTDIAKLAKTEIKKFKGHPAIIQDLNKLQTAAHLAQQNHHSSYLAGKVTQAKALYDSKLPRHIRERIATVAAPAVEATGNMSIRTNVSIGQSLAKWYKTEGDEPVPTHILGASAGISAALDKTQALSIRRADNAFILSTDTNEIAAQIGIHAGAGLTTSAAKETLGNLALNAQLSAKGKISKRGGNIAISLTAESAFSAHHMPKLLKGLPISRVSNWISKKTHIGDLYKGGDFAEVSQEALKRGYGNETKVSASFQELFGQDLTTAYTNQSELGKLMTSMPEQWRHSKADKKSNNIMDKLFPEPLLLSTLFETISFKATGSARVNAVTDFAKHTFPGAKAGVKIGRDSSASLEKTVRSLDSPKLPHDIFNPKMTLSTRCCINYAKDYFSRPSHADTASARPIASAMGFDNVNKYFQAVATSFDEDSPKISMIDRDALIDSYRQFQQDVELIDQFYIQTQASIRNARLPAAQAAIERINQTYNAQLPAIDENNISRLKVSNKNGYTSHYQKFQDTAAAILSGFSAAGGAIKLMASQNNPHSNPKISELGQTATTLVNTIEEQPLPWVKMEIAGRLAYGRRLHSEREDRLLSRGHTISHTNDVLVNGPEGGNYSLTENRIQDALLNGISAGTGIKVTSNKATSTVDHDALDPGQTGTKRQTTISARIPTATGPFKDVREEKTLAGKAKAMAGHLLAQKGEFESAVVNVKTQAYAATQADDPKKEREFLGYESKLRQKNKFLGGAISATLPTGAAALSFGVGARQNENGYNLEHFSYGNDPGTISLIATALIKDHNIDIEAIAKEIANLSGKSKALSFLDQLDPRFTEALLSNQQYDHMSALLSKFRNARFSETTKDGEKVLAFPIITENGVAIPPTSSQMLHNSKGKLTHLLTNKQYADTSGFFAYVVNRYDEPLVQDAYKRFLATSKTALPKGNEVDALLAKDVPAREQHKDSNGKPIQHTRQQWLKSASMQQRKDFYQKTDDGRSLQLSYLLVLKFAGAFSDVYLQNKAFKMTRLDDRIKNVDTLFTSPSAQ